MRRTSLSPASPVVKMAHQPSSNRIQFMQYNQPQLVQMQPHGHYHRTLTEEREQSPFGVHVRQKSNISEVKENVQPNSEYVKGLVKVLFEQLSHDLRNSIL